jgi:hypothetical protein
MQKSLAGQACQTGFKATAGFDVFSWPQTIYGSLLDSKLGGGSIQFRSSVRRRPKDRCFANGTESLPCVNPERQRGAVERGPCEDG